MHKMADEDQHSFIQSIKGKVIIAFAFACFALLLAWGTSKIAFKQMLGAVENISAPNEKLRLVNDLSRRITRLDQLQKSQILHNPAMYYTLFRESKKLNLIIDTLKDQYAGNDVQVKRIRSLKKLLADRDRLFINYLKVREGLVNNKTFSAQVKELNNLVNKSAQQNDSTVTTTEKKTSTTTVFPSDTKGESRGFFGKLFGKKQPATDDKPYKVVDEELNIKHDTLATAKQDSIIRRLGATMSRMERNQRQKSELFVSREAILANASNKVVHQILTILKQVETEVVAQIELNDAQAKNVVNSSIQRITLIILAFLLATIVLLYFILSDITRSNRYRKELELARDEAEYHGMAKQRFLSNMSHEIRTPLQSIIGYAELIKQQEHPAKKDVDAIYHSSEHLMQIVNEVLDYNRIISGKFTFSNQIFNMHELLDEVVSVMRFQAEKKSIAMLTDYNISDAEYAEGDPFRLKQVLYNLLGNAIKFTSAGEVKLGVLGEAKANQVNFTFTITDTGPGISRQDIKRIFNEFEQADGQNPAHPAGTGLGLTISKALVESQGGHIDVKSKLGEGSSFSFTVNYKKAQVPVSQPEKRGSASAALKQGKVWIIDDDTFILDLCHMLLEKNNIPNRCFNSPDEILNTPWDNAVKYILLDIRMPGMSGIQLCNLLRKRIPADVLIYALTAQVMPGERELVLSQGFDGLLMKPFKEHDLLTIFDQNDIAKAGNLADANLDISQVEKMTFGDKYQLNKILTRFTRDCENDSAELTLAVKSYEIEKVILLLHRIAGRTAQIGAGTIAAEFRMAEMELFKDKQLSDDTTAKVLLLTDKLQNLVKQIKRDYLYNEIVM